MTDRDYQHSRPLDIHRWSEHPEANKFVNYVYDTFLNKETRENPRIKKKHLKVVLLDLYVAWLNDPALNIAVHMTQSAYSNGTISVKGKSRYNELNIKGSTIDIVHRLYNAGLIGVKNGWQDSGGRGFITRIWPTEKLSKLFQDAAFSEFDVGYDEVCETIILHDEEKNEVEYDDTDDVRLMRSAVEKYNQLLEKTFIDIQSVDKPARIDLLVGKKRKHANRRVLVNITHHDKFTRRIFKNRSFSDGGRFYGGWWQRVDSNFRKEIRLNNSPIVEIDYSVLHVILAYSDAGIDYWQTTSKDPYDLPVRGISNSDHCRNITKLFLQLSLNATDKQNLFKVFRSELNYNIYPYTFPDDSLLELLNMIKEYHPAIGHLICSGAGSRLTNIDSRICDYVIADFVMTDTPILSVHDGFIVPIGEEDRLHQLMKEAFNEITSKARIEVEYNQNLTKARLYAHNSQHGDWFSGVFQSLFRGAPTNGYKRRLERHREHFGQ